ncbi:entericidin A/B family lipoprotein [Hyphomonas sp.]|jgi:predicted small secreted protein|uniref:entericidin A/B family lipoprotein n=1 Tax=Hyphomonas sp. TaxID=87 RepID=UPI000C45E588|nr:entericidin A/B family lipoprotein [Hyphomonas sp.]MAU68031.1 entericidin, EcnA/B family [Hyphomonas sp.]MBM56843.1 entericidin, EcnA/B family [Hyphomonas sp.]
MKTAKNTLKIAGLGLFTLMAAACNTVAGAGEDIQAGGDVVEDTADEVKEEMSN